ncbi:hypothetical protein JRO89_XS10G0215000 [Xanthoceras sorbifolium]|uniref:DRBM domain-containing protein n=1 Tax=Xanthoceras sorbifolium TaxID=99658 RepID=A0ABQ8HJU9_9ROSI|nr:hypothetical protein JRO89_XS10G0215000 [Xanthoceras sorbifolium]
MKDGPDHSPLFKASVSLNTLSFHSSVSCKSTKLAQNEAAMLAFLHFTSPPPSDFMTSSEPTAGEPKNGETSQGPEIHSKAPDVQCRYKSQLQSYARCKNIDSPSYTSIREGPAHAPCFKATVTVDGGTFESPDFFKSRKAAEHAAANVALMSLSLSGFQEASSPNCSCHFTKTSCLESTFDIDDSGFYKSILQELTQREDLSKPVYKTIKSGAPHMPTFFSTVELEGEVFYGKAGRYKKEAEIKAAKVAYTSLIERVQNQSTGFTSQIIEADGDVKSTLSSELAITGNSQSLEQNRKKLVSSPDIKHTESSKSNIFLYLLFFISVKCCIYRLSILKLHKLNILLIVSCIYASGEIVSAKAKTSSDDTVPSCHMPASFQGGSMTDADVSAPLISDTSVGRDTGTRSYLLCNRVRVYPCLPDISFPKGITVLQISENRWVAVSLEFPNEEDN